MLWRKATGGVGTSGVEFVGATSVSREPQLDLTGITGLQEGDLVVFAAMDDNRYFNIVSSGWTSMTNSSNSNSIEYVIEYKVMGSTVDTRVFLDETVDALCAIAFRGAADPSTPDSYSSSRRVASFSLPTFTIAENNSAALVIALLDDDDSTISTIPAGYTVATTAGRRGGSAAIMFKLVDAGNSIVSGSWSSSDNNLTLGYDISPE